MDPKIQKIKLLKLWEILNRKTDEAHHLTTLQLIDELNKLNITCDRRTLYSDIDTMIEWGYEVQKQRYGRDMFYWVQQRKFDLPEIKLIMDAVESSKFIPPDKTDELLDKIADLGGSSRGGLLRRSARYFNIVKHSNPEIYENIEVSERAIEQGKKVSFHYFDLDIHNERVYRHNKKLYTEEPLAMLCNDGNYYLICYRPEEKYIDHVKVFRLDRMCEISYVDEDICENAIEKVKLIADFPKQAFKMYGGELNAVTLEFDKNLIGVIYNKFGENTVIQEAEDKYRATVQIQISPTFWGWLAQFPGEMKIISPDDVKSQYIEWLTKALEDLVIKENIT